MSWKGRGTRPAARRRRDLVLAYLFDHPGKIETQRIADALDRGYYGRVYQDLRALSGSNTAGAPSPWDGPVNAPGYPVIWNSWREDDARTTWELHPDYRAEVDSQAASLEAAWSLPTGGSTP